MTTAAMLNSQSVNSAQVLADLLNNIAALAHEAADKILAAPIEAADAEVIDLTARGGKSHAYYRRQGLVLSGLRDAGGEASYEEFQALCRAAGYASARGTGGYWNKPDPLIRRTGATLRLTRKGRARLGWIVAQGHLG